MPALKLSLLSSEGPDTSRAALHSLLCLPYAATRIDGVNPGTSIPKTSAELSAEFILHWHYTCLPQTWTATTF